MGTGIPFQREVGHVLIGGVVLGLGFGEGGLNFTELPFVGIHIGSNGLGGQKGFAAPDRWRAWLLPPGALHPTTHPAQPIRQLRVNSVHGGMTISLSGPEASALLGPVLDF